MLFLALAKEGRMTRGWEPWRKWEDPLLASWTPGFSGLPCELVLLMWLPYCRQTAATKETCRAVLAHGSPSAAAPGSGTKDGSLPVKRIHGQGPEMPSDSLSFSLGGWWSCPQREAIHWSWDLETFRVLSLFLGSKTSSCQATPVLQVGMRFCPLRLDSTAFIG